MSHQNKSGQPPEMIWFRCASWVAGTNFPEQAFPWGKLMYSCDGLAKVNVEDDTYLSTPEFAIWLPPQTSHYSLSLTDIDYVIIHFHEKLCPLLPSKVAALRINGIAKEIIKEFSKRSINYPSNQADDNLATVLVEQLALSESFNCFLPISEDRVISKITQKMLDNLKKFKHLNIGVIN
ncbi:AraC family ligand binding domain-containing protein [Rouxiella sp. Mn2063]|uniref:AraC family ligand binding domain-containing protein n=1 Tax=Rouxiella sp. Mn2063 TaxID=3395262 RepID=UPI003BED9E20